MSYRSLGAQRGQKGKPVSGTHYPPSPGFGCLGIESKAQRRKTLGRFTPPEVRVPGVAAHLTTADWSTWTPSAGLGFLGVVSQLLSHPDLMQHLIHERRTKVSPDRMRAGDRATESQNFEFCICPHSCTSAGPKVKKFHASYCLETPSRANSLGDYAQDSSPPE